jgi:hypothetical protein
MVHCWGCPTVSWLTLIGSQCLTSPLCNIPSTRRTGRHINQFDRYVRSKPPTQRTIARIAKNTEGYQGQDVPLGKFMPNSFVGATQFLAVVKVTFSHLSCRLLLVASLLDIDGPLRPRVMGTIPVTPAPLLDLWPFSASGSKTPLTVVKAARMPSKVAVATGNFEVHLAVNSRR